MLMTQETGSLEIDSIEGDGMGACEKETFGGLKPSGGLLLTEVRDSPDRISQKLHKLCQKWLKENFKIDALVRHATIGEREEIDKALNLVTVKFDFVTMDGNDGDSVAFLNEDEVLSEFIL